MISFSFDAKTKSVSIDSILDKELNINDDEKDVVKIIFSFLTPQKIPKTFILIAVATITFPCFAEKMIFCA